MYISHLDLAEIIHNDVRLCSKKLMRESPIQEKTYGKALLTVEREMKTMLVKMCVLSLTSNPDRTTASSPSSVPHNMSSQAEANQVHSVPVSTSSVDQPRQEVAQVDAHIRDSPSSCVVDSVGELSPIHHDDISVLDGEERGGDERVDGRVSVAVPTVDDDLRRTAGSVVGVPDGVRVVVDYDLRVVWVLSKKIVLI